MTATIEVLKCPACGAAVGLKDRRCSYCRSVLLITGADPQIDSSIESDLISKAAATWRTRLQEAPEDPEASHALGLLYYNQNLPDEAIPLFRTATKSAPEVARYHYNLALSLFRNGDLLVPSADYDELSYALRKVSQFDPNFREAAAFRHFFLALKLKKDPQEQLNEYRKAIEQCPDIPVFFSNYGLGLLNAKDFKNAELALKKSISLSPHFFLAHNNLSALYTAVKNFSDGLTKADDALQYAFTDKHQALAYMHRGVALRGLKRNTEAISSFKRAVVLDPNNPQYAKELEATQLKVKPWTTNLGPRETLFWGLCALLFILFLNLFLRWWFLNQ